MLTLITKITQGALVLSSWSLRQWRNGSSSVVKALHMEEGTIWVFLFFTFDNKPTIFCRSFNRLQWCSR